MIINADKIKIGTRFAEPDGFLFTVTEIIKETPKIINVRLCSDFSNINQHWTANGGIIKTFRKSTKLYKAYINKILKWFYKIY